MKKQRITGFAVFAITLGVMGCATNRDNIKGATVEIVTGGLPVAACWARLLASGMPSQETSSPTKTLIGARNDLKNKAAAMGGNVVQAQSTLHGTHPYSSGAISSTVIRQCIRLSH
ncbi:MAG: DUF4156 domain-containing protein [Burkholderiaceae bacterium]